MKYPIGVQTFAEIRNKNYIYIDKTEYIYQLINNGKYYFLSRPRRFGKSLLLSTIEAYFRGDKELFEGLYIYSHTEKWDSYPIFHIDLNAKNYQEEPDLLAILNSYLERWENIYGNDKRDKSVEERFDWLISQAYQQTGRQVVILVDEYDKPLVNNFHRSDLQRAYRAILKSFFGVLKTRDADIRFTLLTGVTKFSKVSIFSDLNNLNDITLDRRYDTLCGITEAEIRDSLTYGVHKLADEYELTYEECLDLLKENYDGYHFSEKLRDIYNPFSIMNALDKLHIGSYWFETGTPTFLARMVRNNQLSLSELDNIDIDQTRILSVDLLSSDPIPLLFQSGYLTIKQFDREFREYRLGFPNREVKEGFLKFLLPLYTPIRQGASLFDIRRFATELRDGEPDKFMQRFSSLFADFPYDQIMDCEMHYHNVIYLTFTLLGFYVRSEYKTSAGRSDIILFTDKYIYIFEFKYDKSADVAIKQINNRNYAAPFAADQREIFKIGVNFSSATRNIDSWIIEQG